MTSVAGSGRIDPFPHLHVRPERGWVNDPNGIGHWNGRWHVMFQWNPNAPVHGDIHWGHMSSADLLAWRDEGVALAPQPGGRAAAGVWSGVAVVDDDAVALVYTAVREGAHDAAVAVARQGTDGTWDQAERTAAEHPDHERWVDVRDPFVLTVDGRRLGLMGAGRAGASPAGGPGRPGRGAVLVYDAADLDHWTLLGPLATADTLPAGMQGAGAIWECPQLVQVGDAWVLVVSWDDGPAAERPGPEGTVVRPMGATAYAGELDVSGPVPVFRARTETPLDHGPDFYAPQLVPDGDRVLGWGWSWEGRGPGPNRRSDAEIAASGWAGTVTFPREVVLDPSGSTRCVPARELAALAGEPLGVRATDGRYELGTAVPAWTATADGRVELDLVDGATGLPRSVWRRSAPGPTRVFVDGSIVEVFGPSGSTTVRAYPAPGESWRLTADEGLEAATLRVPGA